MGSTLKTPLLILFLVSGANTEYKQCDKARISVARGLRWDTVITAGKAGQRQGKAAGWAAPAVGKQKESQCPESFLLLLQLGSSAYGMVIATLEAGLSSSVKPF